MPLGDERTRRGALPGGVPPFHTPCATPMSTLTSDTPRTPRIELHHRWQVARLLLSSVPPWATGVRWSSVGYQSLR